MAAIMRLMFTDSLNVGSSKSGLRHLKLASCAACMLVVAPIAVMDAAHAAGLFDAIRRAPGEDGAGRIWFWQRLMRRRLGTLCLPPGELLHTRRLLPNTTLPNHVVGEDDSLSPEVRTRTFVLRPSRDLLPVARRFG